MLELKAQDFYNAVTRIQHTQTALELREKEQQIAADGSVQVVFVDDPVFLSLMKARLNSLEESLVILNARVTQLAIIELKSRLHALGGLTYEEIAEAFKEIGNTLRRELSLIKVLVLEPKAQDYFAPKEPLLGINFALAFASQGAFELDEAAKCLSLGRPTACVFHCMRLMEAGIKALAQCLGIPDPVKPAEKNWGVILGKIRKDGIEKRWPTAADRACKDAALLESIYASLDAVKNPWRNATMHVENKYTDDEAEHIFLAVKGFMKKLSDRMDEDGNPQA